MNFMIGQRIKERRKQLKITQTDIKKATGISTGNLSQIENGKILPSSTALILLSQVLKCSTDYILFGNSATKNNLEISNIQDQETQLISYYRAMAKDDQNELMVIAQMKANRGKKAKLSLSDEE